MVDEASETNIKANSKASTTEKQGKLADESTLDRLETATPLSATNSGVMMTEEQGRLAKRLSLVQLDDVDSGNDAAEAGRQAQRTSLALNTEIMRLPLDYPLLHIGYIDEESLQGFLSQSATTEPIDRDRLQHQRHRSAVVFSRKN
ncbi:hypothetical protein BELL_0404g00020 [Botrytis elliptica]|uniref:Uncharacterized protein n=1 Tax=Botrytis elliptica TaxID=278938 RepID=A0A4Z1JVN5_9HELO|nr:hypothetical protein BELL_0404g00020 [Botrytis elliptica]